MNAILDGQEMEFFGIPVFDVVEDLFENTIGKMIKGLPIPKAVEEILHENAKFSSMYSITLYTIYTNQSQYSGYQCKTKE